MDDSSVAPNDQGDARINMENIQRTANATSWQPERAENSIAAGNLSTILNTAYQWKPHEMQQYVSNEAYQQAKDESAFSGQIMNQQALAQMHLPMPGQLYQNPAMMMPYNMFNHTAAHSQLLAQYGLAEKHDKQHEIRKCKFCDQNFSGIMELQNHVYQMHYSKQQLLSNQTLSSNYLPQPAQIQPQLSSYLAYQSLINNNMNGIPPAHLLQNPAALGAYLPYLAAGYPPHMLAFSQAQQSVHQPSQQNSEPSHAQQMYTTPQHEHSPQKRTAQHLSLASYEKESLQRRLSAPMPAAGSSKQDNKYIDLQDDRYRNQTAQIGSSGTTSKTPKVNNKLIEDHISNLISHNEKILLNPTLEKVKPRRVYRRNSLDLATLPSHPNPPHTRPQLAERFSYDPRHLDVPTPDLQTPLGRLSPLSSAQLTRSQWPQGLSQPSCSHAMVEKSETHLVPPKQPYFTRVNLNPTHTPGKRSITPDAYCCQNCGVQFRNEETYHAHRKLYCRQHTTSVKAQLSKRQSVIQHTDLVTESDDSASIASTSEMSTSSLVPPSPVKHKDICRTRSADAAFYYNTTNQQEHIPEKRITSPLLEPIAVTNTSSIPTNKLPPKKKQLQLMRNNNLQNEEFSHEFKPKLIISPEISIPPLHIPLHTPNNDAPLSPQRLTPSPVSPKSPGNSTFGSLKRRSKSPSKTPSPNNLENTIPRSNYKLLLHQISMRNMQDIGYLSEAFYTSKNPNLKRCIASILWSEKDSSVNTKTRRRSTGVPITNLSSVSTSENYRRKSHGLLPGELQRLPNYNNPDVPLALQTQEAVTLRNLASENHCNDSSLNAKETLQQSLARRKNHLPLRRQKAGSHIQTQQLPSALIKARNTPSPKNVENMETTQTEQQSVVSKRKISQQNIHDAVPEKKLKIDQSDSFKIINNGEENAGFKRILSPHLNPTLGNASHVSYCSLSSLQPSYMEIEDPKLSMYSQWAVSEAILLPKDLTFADIQRELRVRPMLDNTCYNSLFCMAGSKEQKNLKSVDNKDYEKMKENMKTTKSKELTKTECSSSKEKCVNVNNVNTGTSFQTPCFVSCHNQKSRFPVYNKDILTPIKFSEIKPNPPPPKSNKRKFIMPTVVIHPPSPENTPEEEATSPKSCVEFSDSDSDDNVIEDVHNVKNSQKQNSSVNQKLKEKLLGKLISNKVRHSSSSDTESTNVTCKKRRKSRKLRDAVSPLLQRRKNMDFPLFKKNGIITESNKVQDPSLAVHPTGACSKNASQPPCALCSMKASPASITDAKKSSSGEVSPNEDEAISPPPLTVSVPVRNREKHSSKSSKGAFAPAKLDRARGNGSTQHWVSSNEELKPHLTSINNKDKDNTTIKSTSSITPKFVATNTVVAESLNVAQTSSKYVESPQKCCKSWTNSTDSSFSDDVMPPNKNPATISVETRDSTKCTAQLAEVVSEVMRSAAIQSQQKKTIAAKKQHPLATSRPLIPGGFTPKTESKTDSSVAPPRVGNISRLSAKQLSLSEHESELFLNRANKTCDKTIIDAEKASAEGNGSPNEDGSNRKDDGKDFSDGEIDGPSPRQFKCSECKTAFRIAGHLAKHLKSKSHTIAMQKKTLNRLKQQQLNGGILTNEVTQTTTNVTTLASEQPAPELRAIFESNEAYTEISQQPVASTSYAEPFDNETDKSSDPRPFKCTACKVAFRFQGHLDRHFRSNHHLLAVGHFELDKNTPLRQPMSDDETWETATDRKSPTSQESPTNVEKCKMELAETDKKLQQLQMLSDSVNESKISLLNHNASNEKSFTSSKNMPKIGDEPEPTNPLDEVTFVNCCAKNSSVMPDERLSPAQIKVQQLSC